MDVYFWGLRQKKTQFNGKTEFSGKSRVKMQKLKKVGAFFGKKIILPLSL
jgi:hypothetical protein